MYTLFILEIRFNIFLIYYIREKKKKNILFKSIL